MSEEAPIGARVSIERTVEWPDTDAAGHHHHSVVIRWVEAAEAALYAELGLSHLFGLIPRVQFQANYLARLWFGDRVTASLQVAHVGRTSVRYEFEIKRGDEIAAAGHLIAAHLDRDAGAATPWPPDVRARLLGTTPT